MYVLSRVRLSATPWTVGRQAPLWEYSGKNTGVGSHFLLQGTFPTQGSNSCLLHLQILYQLGSPINWLLLFVVQWLSRVGLFATPWTAAHEVSLSFLIGYTPMQNNFFFF